MAQWGEGLEVLLSVVNWLETFYDHHRQKYVQINALCFLLGGCEMHLFIIEKMIKKHLIILEIFFVQMAALQR